MAVKEGLLALLEQGPRYGYQLKTEFEAATGGVWPLNVGQVYTTLERLERDGLVEASESDGQKRFQITLAGASTLGEWWQATPTDEPPPRDELMLKMLMAIEHGPDHALSVLTRQRTALLSLLQRRRRSGATSSTATSTATPGAAAALAASLVGDALVVRAEADMRWLELCEARLQAARSVTNAADSTTPTTSKGNAQ